MDFLGINLFHDGVPLITALKLGDRTALPFGLADNRRIAVSHPCIKQKTMTTKKQLLQNLEGERVIIYTVEKEFSGILRADENEFTVSNHKDTVRLTCNSGTHKNRF